MRQSLLRRYSARAFRPVAHFACVGKFHFYLFPYNVPIRAPGPWSVARPRYLSTPPTIRPEHVSLGTTTLPAPLLYSYFSVGDGLFSDKTGVILVRPSNVSPSSVGVHCALRSCSEALRNSRSSWLAHFSRSTTAIHGDTPRVSPGRGTKANKRSMTLSYPTWT